MTKNTTGPASQGLISGMFLALAGAVLFSAKAVLAKMIYQIYPISVVNLLCLRMLFSLPFFLAIFLVNRPKYQARPSAANPVLLAVLIGILGYYISSFLDFSGLKYVSAGLERIILFSYPTFVLLFGAWFYKTPISKKQVIALLLAYAGVTVAFVGDLKSSGGPNLWLGSALVAGCAVTYGLYVLWGGRIIPILGAPLFTSIAMISATVAVFSHFLIKNSGFSGLLGMPVQVYWYMLVMAVFTTVLPSLAVSAALKRIGSSQVAIISCVGPLATIIQARIFLGERFGLFQALGTLLVISGVLIVGQNVKKSRASSRP